MTDGREAFMSSMQEDSRCLTCRERIPAGVRCCCVDFVRKDGTRIVSLMCMGCTSAVGVAAQLRE
jgi:hypothetical protein